jgi:hypothetical protein
MRASSQATARQGPSTADGSAPWRLASIPLQTATTVTAWKNRRRKRCPCSHAASAIASRTRRSATIGRRACGRPLRCAQPVIPRSAGGMANFHRNRPRAGSTTSAASCWTSGRSSAGWDSRSRFSPVRARDPAIGAIRSGLTSWRLIRRRTTRAHPDGASRIGRGPSRDLPVRSPKNNPAEAGLQALNRRRALARRSMPSLGHDPHSSVRAAGSS